MKYKCKSIEKLVKIWMNYNLKFQWKTSENLLEIQLKFEWNTKENNLKSSWNWRDNISNGILI